MQGEIDEWVHDYNTERPHQALDMATPGQRFWREDAAEVAALRPVVDRPTRPHAARGDGYWVSRRASAVGVITVNWQQVCLGIAAASRAIDVWVTNEVLQCFDGDQLLRTSARTTEGTVRKKRASTKRAT